MHDIIDKTIRYHEVFEMNNKKPSFEITNEIIDRVAEIAELVGRLNGNPQLIANPALRRNNRIRTIYGSLAIEQNTLSLEQVTAVLNGKHVLAPPKDIAEVKNAYEIYDRLEDLDPYSIDDLLDAHATPLDWIPKIKYLCPNRKIRITGNNINTLATIAIPMSSCVILARNRDMGQRFWLFKNTSGCSIAFQASIKDKSNADRMPGIPSGRPILI